ncbi:MAG: TIGR01777 family protein [Planctomycetes bacterium]|nr:TIGR01777 family protein [Planctomycetota bacterium]
MTGEASRLRIVAGGASGLVGSALIAALAAEGHHIERLVRGGRTIRGDEIAWSPEHGEIDVRRLDGRDAAIHLGGVTIAQRFTEKHKAAIRDSRVRSTRLLSETLAGLATKPRVLIVASAVGYYGDRGEQELDESSSPGSGFLPETCQAWEAAAQPARDASIRVVHLRFGMVLSSRGGALAKMLPAFRRGLGGRLGSGRQYMSWVSLEDAVGAALHALRDEQFAGPINVTGPSPVTNREFTAALGRALRRPTLLPVPAAAIRLALGEMGQTLLLEGCRAVPRVLLKRGYRFAHPTLEAAIQWALADDG